MSAEKKWIRQVRVMAEWEGLCVESVVVNGRGHLCLALSCRGQVLKATVSRTHGKRRTQMETRACFRRLVRSIGPEVAALSQPTAGRLDKHKACRAVINETQALISNTGAEK
ncbi:MAG: hypothetical protein JSR72_23735 [Proteobacteria bacterium]|nr:hypothetical protein [Pseudomonadota bacterium]